MAYEITKKLTVYEVTVDGVRVGEIVPQNTRPQTYLTEVWLEDEALADDTGYPNEYRTLKDAKEAVWNLMQRNGVA